MDSKQYFFAIFAMQSLQGNLCYAIFAMLFLVYNLCIAPSPCWLRPFWLKPFGSKCLAVEAAKYCIDPPPFSDTPSLGATPRTCCQSSTVEALQWPLRLAVTAIGRVWRGGSPTIVR